MSHIGATTSRRSLVRSGLSAGALTAAGLVAPGAAEAARQVQPAGKRRNKHKNRNRNRNKHKNKKRRKQRKLRRFHGAPLLTGSDRHLVSRFSYGVTPDLTRRVRSDGGARA